MMVTTAHVRADISCTCKRAHIITHAFIDSHINERE